MKGTNTGLFILLSALLFISIFYGYPAMLHLLPQGSHLWRQADCVAMSQNYQQFHLPFFQPQTYNLQSLNGRAAGEFPLFYFISAQLINVAFALRLLHTLIFISGISATYFIAFHFLQRRFLSLMCSLFMFTSPLLVFYGNNFLSDVPALSMAFIGWAFFLTAYKKSRLFGVGISFLCFALAGLLKASELINLAMITLFLLLQKDRNALFKWSLAWTILCGLLVFSWYFYAKQYNLENHDTYYFLSVFPVWKLSLYDIGLGAWRMLISLSKNYFWRPTSVLMIISAGYVFRHRNKLDRELRVVLLSGLAMTLLYILLFYQKMIGHEYYYVPFFVPLIFGIIAILKTYNSYHAENVFSHAVLFLFLIPNLLFCKTFVKEKLTDATYNGYLAAPELQRVLVWEGIRPESTVLSLPDDSPNKTLSLLKRKGYTEFNDYKEILKNGKADYLVLSNDCWKQKNSLQPYLKDSIGRFHGITLYKLK